MPCWYSPKLPYTRKVYKLLWDLRKQVYKTLINGLPLLTVNRSFLANLERYEKGPWSLETYFCKDGKKSTWVLSEI